MVDVNEDIEIKYEQDVIVENVKQRNDKEWYYEYENEYQYME